MIDILQQILAFVVTLSLLVSFHEFGHFWVARKCNVKILRFSIGFGKPLWSTRLGTDQFEFVIAALPLGGYVKMLDERDCKVETADLSRAFNNKPLLQRAVIVLAGPIFNFIFAIIAFWLMFMIGISGVKPIVGSVDAGSVAERAGLYEGVEIIAIDSRETKTWMTVASALTNKVVESEPINMTIRDEWNTTTLILDTQGVSINELAVQDVLTILGIRVKKIDLPAIVGDVQFGFPAAKAGVLPQDLIISADDQQITSWQQWVTYVQARPEKNIVLQVKRRDQYLTLNITPQEKVVDKDSVIGFVGVMSQPLQENDARLSKESYSVTQALLKSLGKTWDMSKLTLSMLGKMITGQISLKHLSGPISIAQYADNAIQVGIVAFLWFLAIISISLGVLNLLPIPMLDGGHLLYYAIELLKGSPVSEGVEIIGQQVGGVLLLVTMVLVTYNDIMRTFL